MRRTEGYRRKTKNTAPMLVTHYGILQGRVCRNDLHCRRMSRFSAKSCRNSEVLPFSVAIMHANAHVRGYTLTGPAKRENPRHQSTQNANTKKDN